MTFGSTLEWLATRNKAKSGRGAWKTRHCEPLGAALLGRLSGLSNHREDHGPVSIKLPTNPFCWSVLSLSLSSCVTLGFLFRNLPILFCNG